jgi:hypothetical protein
MRRQEASRNASHLRGELRQPFGIAITLPVTIGRSDERDARLCKRS